MKLTKKQKKDIDDLLIKVINETKNTGSKNFDLTHLSNDEVVEIIRNMGDNDTVSITVINNE
jgi:hypothetical protein